MIKMKVLIKSVQIFETHEDSVEEKYDCEFLESENGFEIIYDGTKIRYLDDVVYVDRENSSLVIEKGKINNSKLNTPYGVINMEIKGESVECLENPFDFKVRYLIKLGNLESYINELRILFVEE